MSDEIIWQVINQQFCAFKLKTTKEQNFCRNEYNVSGLCSRQSCPLANAKYATVKNVDGKLYLYMKTVERAHTPSKLWERIKLSKNYTKALDQVDQHLLYWKKFLIHKCKQRLTRLTQVAITERRLALREEERHYVGVKHKVKRREETRERKALTAAKIEKSIEKELLDRLKSGAYGDKPLNVDEKIWKKVLGTVEDEDDLSQDELNEDEYDDVELQDEEDDSDVGEVEYVEDDMEDDEDLVDVEDLERWLGNSDSESDDESDSDDGSKKRTKKLAASDDKRAKRRARVEVEYEEEPIVANTINA
ncbi:hypothetical protein BABINDRAFT_41773 [Babjeviella inositovora NRRL Y-12698]|uniref:Protein MAK16 n=1 Tax=Babjeviella inositovora NRRL Y-12698 TaxID=984486 RepID=A0A1E3QIP0_9ASCO|nr:uncharacterized protein BABINDRAFT_41773 [Babjeviella inositovora NRRL Y-12698]ODQ77314.1 hypothetical protein BABINDRAFT_41773 [Babjeviella inositovora NRRL Y-12698]